MRVELCVDFFFFFLSSILRCFFTHDCLYTRIPSTYYIEYYEAILLSFFTTLFLFPFFFVGIFVHITSAAIAAAAAAVVAVAASIAILLDAAFFLLFVEEVYFWVVRILGRTKNVRIQF